MEYLAIYVIGFLVFSLIFKIDWIDKEFDNNMKMDMCVLWPIFVSAILFVLYKEARRTK